MGELVGKSSPRFDERTGRHLYAVTEQTPAVLVRRDSWDRVIAKNRRLRRLLVDCMGFLIKPGPPERQLERRTRLVARIKAATDE